MTADDLKDASKDIANDAQDAVKGVRGQASASAAKVADKVGATVSDLGANVGDGSSQLGTIASGIREQMPASAGKALEAGRDAIDKGGEVLSRRVARQPIEALLLAGAIGYLVGWAANRS